MGVSAHIPVSGSADALWHEERRHCLSMALPANLQTSCSSQLCDVGVREVGQAARRGPRKSLRQAELVWCSCCPGGCRLLKEGSIVRLRLVMRGGERNGPRLPRLPSWPRLHRPSGGGGIHACCCFARYRRIHSEGLHVARGTAFTLIA